MRIRLRPRTARRVAGYAIAAAAGFLLSGTLLLLINYFNGPYVNSKRDIAKALGLSQLGWAGPLLILLVVVALALYLARVSSFGDEERWEASEVRCIACGQEIIHDWKLCPYCGSLIGTIKHLNENAG